MWFAGGLAAVSSLIYPSISAFVSIYAKDNQQGIHCLDILMNKTFDLGLVQGMVNGVRGLCNGLGPALFGFTFYLFNVDLGYTSSMAVQKSLSNTTAMAIGVQPIFSSMLSRDIPGPPFLFGAFLATIALMFSLLLPNTKLEMNNMGSDARTIEQRARLLTLNEETKELMQID